MSNLVAVNQGDPLPPPAWPQSTYICKYVVVKISASHGYIAGRGRCWGWLVLVHGAPLWGVTSDHWPGEMRREGMLGAKYVQSNRHPCIQTHRAEQSRAEIVRQLLKPHEHQECLSWVSIIHIWEHFKIACYNNVLFRRCGNPLSLSLSNSHLSWVRGL